MVGGVGDARRQRRPAEKVHCVSRVPRLGPANTLRAGRSAEKQFPQYSLQDVPADRAASAVVVRRPAFLASIKFLSSSLASPCLRRLSKKIFPLESLFSTGVDRFFFFTGVRRNIND